MASIHDRYEQQTFGLKRKLFDNQIRLMGNELTAIRVVITEDEYKDEEYEIVSHNTITCIINFPAEIPLFRYRANNNNDVSDSNGIYLFDVLPIELYTKWDDNMEKGDILITKMTDENDEVIKMLFRVSETLGTFAKYLNWKKSHIAPFNGYRNAEINRLIEEF